MPDESNEGLVPPLKVLRKRLDGVYRADGFAGPTRRYVLLVALLVGLASLPTLAAITAGSNELDDGTTGAMDVPFLPPPSAGPVIPVLPSPSPSPSPASPSSWAGAQGQAGKRRTMPPQDRSSSSPRWRASSHSPESGSSGTQRPTPEDATPPGRPVPPPDRPTEPVDPADVPTSPSRPPFCHERGRCGSHEGHHHRPGWSRHRYCEDSTHRAVHIVPTGRHARHHTIRERHAEMFRTIVSHRSSDRSEHSRRSTMTERPHNLRPASTLGRTHNSRRYRHAEARWDDAQAPTRSYHGSHRAERVDRTDDAHTRAYDRSSRVGRHHADDHQDRFNRR